MRPAWRAASGVSAVREAMTLISIACNHPDNGHFIHRFASLHYGDEQDMEIVHKFCGPRSGVSIKYLGDYRVRISHRIFTFQREKEWFGNWCWNAFWMERREARRLLRYLRDSGSWICEGGPDRLYRWFNANQSEAA
jgi:hypothetical protein